MTTTMIAPLTHRDRCDRCGAAAKARAILATGELTFCGHHTHEYEAQLTVQGATLEYGSGEEAS